jgi:hypothetical protein
MDAYHQAGNNVEVEMQWLPFGAIPEHSQGDVLALENRGQGEYMWVQQDCQGQLVDIVPYLEDMRRSNLPRRKMRQ